MTPRTELLATMTATLMANIPPTPLRQAVVLNQALEILEAVEADERNKEPGHVSTGLHATGDRGLRIRTQRWPAIEGHPRGYDTVDLGPDLTLYLDRQHTVRLRDLLSKLIEEYPE